MKTTRRDFVRKLGILLAAAFVKSCRTPTTCYVPLPSSTPHATPTPNPNWITLRSCWYDLDNPELASFEETAFPQELRQRHTETLELLVSDGELESPVAGEINLAFDHAIAHIQRSMVTCYIGLPAYYYPREDLLQQAALLEEMSALTRLDPDTVDQAQTALQRDIAWLAQFEAGLSPGSLEDTQADPTSAMAARILVALLLGIQPEQEASAD